MQKVLNESNFWDCKVPCKPLIQSASIAILGSKKASDLVLSYLDYRQNVVPLLQKTSHGMRCYMKATDGLRNTLVVMTITTVLNQLISKERLNKISKYQDIDADLLNH